MALTRRTRHPKTVHDGIAIALEPEFASSLRVNVGFVHTQLPGHKVS